MGQIPATIGWLPGTTEPTGRGFMDEMHAQPLVEVSAIRFTPVPRYPAWRCVNCKRVEFTYGDAILKAGKSTLSK